MGKPSSKTTPKTTNNKFWKFCNLADSQKAELFLTAIFLKRAGGVMKLPRNSLRTISPLWAM